MSSLMQSVLLLSVLAQQLPFSIATECELLGNIPRNLTITSKNLEYTLTWQSSNLKNSTHGRNITYTVYLALVLQSGDYFNWNHLSSCIQQQETSCSFQLKNIESNYVVSVQANIGACRSERAEAKVFLSPRNTSLLSPPRFEAHRNRDDIFILPEPVGSAPLYPNYGTKEKLSLVDIFLRLQYQIELSTFSNHSDITVAEATTTEINIRAEHCNQAMGSTSQCCIRLRFFVPDLAGEGYPLGTGNWSDWKCFNVTKIITTTPGNKVQGVHMSSFVVTSVVLLSVVGLIFSICAVYKAWKLYQELYKQKHVLPESLERVMEGSPSEPRQSQGCSSLEVLDVFEQIPNTCSLTRPLLVKHSKQNSPVRSTLQAGFVNNNLTKQNFYESEHVDVFDCERRRKFRHHCYSDGALPSPCFRETRSGSSVGSAVYNQSYTKFDQMSSMATFETIDTTRFSNCDLSPSWDNRDDHFRNGLFSSDIENEISQDYDHNTPNVINLIGAFNSDYVAEVSNSQITDSRNMLNTNRFNDDVLNFNDDMDYLLDASNRSDDFDRNIRGFSTGRHAVRSPSENDDLFQVGDDDVFTEKLRYILNDVASTAEGDSGRSASVDCTSNFQNSSPCFDEHHLFESMSDECIALLTRHDDINANRMPESDSAYVTMDDIASGTA